MKTFLLLLHVALPLIGLADAGYITYEDLTGYIPPCGAGFDCGTVLTSPYSHIGPVPIAALGLLYYTTLLILGVLLMLEIEISHFLPKSLKKIVTTQQLYTAITAFGLLFSFYLLFVMAVVLQSWCLYCLISAITSVALFIVSWKFFILTQKNKPHVLLKTISHTVFAFLYRNLLKKVLFLLDPETVHNAFSHQGNSLGRWRITRTIVHMLFAYQSPTTARVLNGIYFPNPIGLSAGFDYNAEMVKILGPVGFGFHTVGTVTLLPYKGNPKPRLGRLPNSKALIVNKGLKSLGAPAIIERLSGLQFDVPIGISIGATNKLFDTPNEQILDIATSFVLFEKSPVTHRYYELNISCPNTFGGEPFTTPGRLEQLLDVIDTLHLSRPLFIKMPIDQSKKETLQLLAVADEHDVQGVIFGNLTKDKNNPDITEADRAVWKKRKGNLSGKPTFKRSNDLIQLTRENFADRFTIIGCGGIFDQETAQTKLDAGADLLQMITGMVFGGPQTIGNINRQLDTKHIE